MHSPLPIDRALINDRPVVTTRGFITSVDYNSFCACIYFFENRLVLKVANERHMSLTATKAMSPESIWVTVPRVNHSF